MPIPRRPVTTANAILALNVLIRAAETEREELVRQTARVIEAGQHLDAILTTYYHRLEALEHRQASA